MTTSTHPPRKPRSCQSCGHRTARLSLRTVDAPTAQLRAAAHQAGIHAESLWLCDNATACLSRLIDRTRR